jgi:hypothetical protein
MGGTHAVKGERLGKAGCLVEKEGFEADAIGAVAEE